ncbi:MAG: tyrosine-type recombinase/integrase [Geminicoccaceae bacterium]
MAKRKRLMDVVVSQAKAADTRYEIAEPGGLALRVSPNGAKSWVWRYRAPNGTQKRLTLGKGYPATSLADARSLLATAQQKLERGQDPADARPAKEKVADLAEAYMERHGSKLRTAAEEQRRITVDILPTLGSRKVVEVTRRDLSDLLHGKLQKVMAGKGTSGVSVNRIYATLQRMFGKAVSWGWIEHSPADRLEKPVIEQSRARALDDAEIARLWHALELLSDERMTLALRLQLLTACRLGEVVAARKGDLDLAAKVWVIPAEHSKNGLAHEVPLSDLAVSLFRQALANAALRMQRRTKRHGEQQPSEYVFPGWHIGDDVKVRHLRRDATDRAFAALIRKIGMAPTVPHDLRRTASTKLHALGVQPHVVEAVLNHMTGARAGVAGVYNRHSYAAEKRDALERWADDLMRLTGASCGLNDVVALRRSA